MIHLQLWFRFEQPVINYRTPLKDPKVAHLYEIAEFYLDRAPDYNTITRGNYITANDFCKMRISYIVPELDEDTIQQVERCIECFSISYLNFISAAGWNAYQEVMHSELNRIVRVMVAKNEMIQKFEIRK